MRDEKQREDANAFLDLLYTIDKILRKRNIHSDLNGRLGAFLAELLELVCESLAIGEDRGTEVYSK